MRTIQQGNFIIPGHFCCHSYKIYLRSDLQYIANVTYVFSRSEIINIKNSRLIIMNFEQRFVGKLFLFQNYADQYENPKCDSFWAIFG